MFIVKRKGDVIQHFHIGLDMQTLPTWDARELGKLETINPTNKIIVADFGRLILRECVRGLTMFKPRCPKRRVTKTTKDPMTEKGKVTWMIDPTKVVTRWFYDGKTREAVIRSNNNDDIRFFDPMDMFMFCLSDLNILYGHKIHVGARNEYMEERMLFQCTVERARDRKKKMMEILFRLNEQKERNEAKKKKDAEKSAEPQSSTPQDKDPSSEIGYPSDTTSDFIHIRGR
ncbi:hypothetical protein Hanom_Chr13g01200261 [Helianthus anomalus]